MDIDKNLRLEIRQASRNRFNQTMGELRSMASACRATGALKSTEDEEAYFLGLVAEHFYVLKYELYKLLGPATAQRILDLYKANGSSIQP